MEGSQSSLTLIWPEGVTLLGDAMAEAEVDAGDLVGHQWMILQIHTGVGTMRLGWKEVNQLSMGLGWDAQIGTSLSTKGPKGSGVI